MCETPGQDGALGEQLERDPQALIGSLRAMLDNPQTTVSRQPSTAHLYAMLADAYGTVGDLTQAQSAVAKGQNALTASDDDVLRRRLLLHGLFLRATHGDVADAVSAYDSASAAVPDGAPDLVCVLLNRGDLRQSMGRYNEGLADVTRAYTLAKDHGSIANQVLAAAELSDLYRATGFPDESRQYAEEIIAQAEKSGNRMWLAEGHFRRADAFRIVNDFASAETDILRSLELWKDVGTPDLVEAAEQRLCAIQTKLPDLEVARSTCIQSYKMGLAVNMPTHAKAVLASLGEIELRAGHLRTALMYFDRALADDGISVRRGLEARFHGMRAPVRAQLGDYRGAFKDQAIYLEWLQHKGHVAENMGQIAVSRARFEAAMQNQQLLRARDAARSAALEASRQLRERSIVMTLVTLLAAMAALLLWMQRRRRDVQLTAQAAEEKLGTIGRLAGGIAHDFNNELTVMMQATGLLANRHALSSDPAAGELLQAIRESGVACVRVTAQLLSFSRQQHLRPESIPLGNFIERLQPAIERRLGENVKLHCEFEAPEPVALADRRQLEVAVFSLIDNARDSMPEGGTVTIRVGAIPGDVAWIEVVDLGTGMTPEILARATEPFFTTRPVGGGSGLGLSMVEGFMKQSMGAMRITSEANRGTTVRIQFPAGREGQAAERRPPN
jgi:signal transduction histidine kinase